jgi:hypothetical protein
MIFPPDMPHICRENDFPFGYGPYLGKTAHGRRENDFPSGYGSYEEGKRFSLGI